jgi:hypothetical protein
LVDPSLPHCDNLCYFARPLPPPYFNTYFLNDPILLLHGKKGGKGKTIAGVTSQFYHRSFIIAILSSQLNQLSFTIAIK